MSFPWSWATRITRKKIKIGRDSSSKIGKGGAGVVIKDTCGNVAQIRVLADGNPEQIF